MVSVLPKFSTYIANIKLSRKEENEEKHIFKKIIKKEDVFFNLNTHRIREKASHAQTPFNIKISQRKRR